MKNYKIVIKTAPAIVLLSTLLTGCQELKNFFNEPSESSRYDSSYSSTHRHQSQPHDTTVKPKTVSSNVSSANSGGESGTAATTVNAPVSMESKGVKSTVDSPAVPSMAPTVGQ